MKVKDECVCVYVVDKGDFEVQIFIGFDVLVFYMYINVFCLLDDNLYWKMEYMLQDCECGYFGIINIYNFLVDFYLKNCMNDLGYLIGWIFVNKEEYFMVEGKGQFGFLFCDFQ